MDTAIKLFFALFALTWLLKPRKTFYAPWNVDPARYKSSRTMLYLGYFGCVGIFLYGLAGDNAFRFIFGSAQGKGIPSSVETTVFGTLYVFFVLAIDANYIASCRAGLEANAFKNWLFGVLSLPIFVTVIFLNRYLIPVFVVVWIAGWFYQPPKAA